MTSPTRPLIASVGAVALAAVTALGLAACGSGSTIVIAGSDGTAVASVGPSGQVSISSSDGSMVIGEGSLPDGWPADVGQPEGFAVLGSANTTVDGKTAYTATFSADGDQTAAVTAWIAQLKSNGFTQEAGFGGGGAGITSLKNATTQVAIISTVADGRPRSWSTSALPTA
jgi:hypothetical protein